MQSENREQTFDWTTHKAQEIKWAAFYGDCKHEVRTVTDGHRITLTYNLYAHEQVSIIYEPLESLEIKSLALYNCAREALACPDFLPRGT